MAASDDSHLAGDSKPSENKHFAGMAAEVTEGTSDDTHLADDSKRQENAAGSSGYAPPVREERRIANDGNSYTFREFLDYYGEGYGNSKWTAAQDTPPPAPPPQEIVEVEAAAVNTLLTPPPAPPPQEILEVQVGGCSQLAARRLQPVGPASLLLQLLPCQHARGLIGEFRGSRCQLCDAGRALLAKDESACLFRWYCMSCILNLSDLEDGCSGPHEDDSCPTFRGSDRRRTP